MATDVVSAEGVPESLRREANRRRALAAMTQVVGEQGYPETTVRDVLERAKMSRRTFYELFDNREECFLAAYELACGEAFACLDGAQEPPEPFPEHLNRVLTRFLEQLADRPDFARLLLVEATAIGPSGVELHEQTMRRLAERLAESLPNGKQGLAPDEVRLRCEASVGAIHRVLLARIVEGRSRDLPELADELVPLVRALAAAG
ncbi:MAG TPA: TetR/AcrR family transcriptional regulator [Thermoleophilaceae bacterium]|jgi:AcrR family transcriptional regulator